MIRKLQDNVKRARQAIAARRKELERAKLPAKVRAKLEELGLYARTDDEHIEYR